MPRAGLTIVILRRILHEKAWFTLIEMVLVVGLLTTLVIGLTAIFRPMIATYQKSALQTDLKDKSTDPDRADQQADADREIPCQ